MLQHYLILALRNSRRHANYTLINIAGLALGLACCLIIALYVHHELSFDRFNEHADRIYRVVQEQRFATTQQVAVMSSPVAPALVSTFPEIETAVRFYAAKDMMHIGQSHTAEVTIAYVDSTVFSVFSLPLLQGNPSQVLVAPNSIVLTESTAQKFFGSSDPVGQIVQYGERELKVTGVMVNIPSHAHFDFEAFVSYSSLDMEFDLHSWGRNSMWTYLLLQPDTSPEALEAKFPAFIKNHIERSDALDVFSYYLQPLTDIHLHSHMVGEIGMNNDISTVYIFSAIAFLILIIASINYINLATARSSQRVREVGIRKVMGANREQLIFQFLGESTLLTFLGVLGALVLVRFFMPFFNVLFGINLKLDPIAVAVLVGFFLVTGLLAGAYPAFHLSRFRPVKVLNAIPPEGGVTFRKALVIVQFTMSITLIIAVGVTFEQLRYMENKDLGFEKEHLISLGVRGEVDKVALLKEELARQPEVLSVATSRTIMGDEFPSTTFRREGTHEDDMLMVSYFDIDPDFVETMGIQVLAGRNFSKELVSDIEGSILINEAAVHAFGWTSAEEAIGNRITQGWTPEIIGVVKDFHFKTLHQSIDPLVLWWEPPELRTVTVRTVPGDLDVTLASLEAAWNRVLPGQPFTFTLLEEHLNTLYKSDHTLGRLIGLFAVLAIFIACLGLLGLTSFTYQQRKKEIGVRKVLGASVRGIVTMLSKEVLQLIVIAFLLAVPLAYFAMKSWLDGFAYHIEPTLWVFIIAGMMTMVVALLAVIYQSVEAALSNPVKSLRFE